MILSVFLGIDIGTTAIKLGVIQESKLLYSSDLPLQTYGDDRIKYQDGNELLAILQAGILAMPLNVRREITKLSFSTAMHSLMPDDGRRQIFLWSDLQAAETIDRFKQTKLATHFYEISGTPCDVSFCQGALFSRRKFISGRNSLVWYKRTGYGLFYRKTSD